MIKTLTLENFKNFKDATLNVGELTLLVGTNASGKSNVRDAFRFLHGVSRGYTLAEIVGEKWIDGGVLQWRGIRGGIREIAYRGHSLFSIEAALTTGETYRIVVKSTHPAGLRVVGESLHVGRKAVFDSRDSSPPQLEPAQFLSVSLRRSGSNDTHKHRLRFSSAHPVLTQIASSDEVSLGVKVRVKQVIDSLGSMRFLDLAPDAMRQSSLPGQTVLGDRGENLSSVLQSIVADPSLKNALLEWIKELTPLDVTDFEFVADQTGRVLVTLVESDGQRTSAYSASDGTLRFLAIISALLAPSAARFYFFEELENGIHAARLYLLLQLIEQHVSSKAIQVVATSHSPQLLGILGKKARESAALIYRLSGSPDARISRIVDIPDAKRVLGEQDLARLYASGWLEDAVSFVETASGNGRELPIGGGA
jgi:predicted ATPase